MKNNRKIRSIISWIIAALCFIFCVVSAYGYYVQRKELLEQIAALQEVIYHYQQEYGIEAPEDEGNDPAANPGQYGEYVTETGFDLSTVPPFDGQLYCEVNGNVPFFTEDDYTTQSFEEYSPLDDLGRCGVAYACVGVDLMPTKPRGEIGMIKPTGWMISKYDFIDGKYLYNRCHLIAHQLSGENANEQNLITGTRFMNAGSMEPFESLVGGYVRSTNNHVLYRVTPVFVGDNLLASGVLMEAYSVEDNGAGICFCIFCHNAQPNVGINYADGTNWLIDGETENTSSVVTQQTDVALPSSDEEYTYIVNTGSGRFHYEWCSSVEHISEKNREEVTATREELIAQGYKPCGECHP